MKTITFTCETITPMFLSGADGQTPELRPPSIKGAMRFWWRAMNGHLVNENDGESDYLSLKDNEQSLFGGTGGFKIDSQKRDAVKSHFSIRVFTLKDAEEITYSSKKDYSEKEGLRYFYYLIVPDTKGKVMSENDQALKPFSEFKVILSADEDEILLKASACFWMLTYLGGIGSRARRGGGCFCIKNITDNSKIIQNRLVMQPSDNIKQFFEIGLKKISSIISNNKGDITNNTYSTISKSESIYISKVGKENWKDALNEVGLLMKKIRTDSEREPKLRTQTQATLNQKAAFGLPISVRNEKNVVEFTSKNDFNHRSSPFIISILKCGNRYHWTLTHLQGEFMPSESDIKIEFKPTSGLRSRVWDDVDEELVDKFIQNITKESHLINYTL